MDDSTVKKDRDRFITVNHTAEILGCTVQYIYMLIRAGDLRGIRIGTKALRVSSFSLDEFINSRWIDPAEYLDEGYDEQQDARPKKAVTNIIAKSAYVTTR
jgi:excisionase family DNA binding protein